MAATVLLNDALWPMLMAYQHGLPWCIGELERLSATITLAPVADPGGPLCLHNVPPRFLATPYLRRNAPQRHAPLTAGTLFLYDKDAMASLPLHLSILEGHLRHIVLWGVHRPHLFQRSTIELAAACGHTDIVQHLATQMTLPVTTKTVDLAAMNGNEALLRWLFDLPARRGGTRLALDGAAAHGHLAIVQLLVSKGRYYGSHHAVAAAVHNGHINIARFLLESGRYAYNAPAYMQDYYGVQHVNVPGTAQLACIKLLLATYHADAIDAVAIEGAIRTSGVAALVFCFNAGVVALTSRLIEYIANLGDVDAMRFALQQLLQLHQKPAHWLSAPSRWWGSVRRASLTHTWCPSGWSMCRATDIAAARGHLGVLQLLHAARLDCGTSSAIVYAAASGHLATVQWLYETLRDLNVDVALSSAAAYGHSDVVDALLGMQRESQRRLPLEFAWTTWCLDPIETRDVAIIVAHVEPQVAAAATGHVEILQRLPPRVSPAHLVDEACKHGHLNVVKALWSECDGSYSLPTLLKALAAGHLLVVEYLLLHGKLWSASKFSDDAAAVDVIYTAAAHQGNVDVYVRIAACLPHGVSRQAIGTLLSDVIERRHWRLLSHLLTDATLVVSSDVVALASARAPKNLVDAMQARAVTTSVAEM